MVLKRVKTRRGVIFQDEITGQLGGSEGLGKKHPPTPGFQELSSQVFDLNVTPKTIEELEYRHAQYKAEMLRLEIEATGGSIILDELEEIVEVEEWDIIDITPELVAQRNEELNLAEEEAQKAIKEIEKSKPKKTYSSSKTNRSAKKKAIEKAPVYRLPMEKYGPQWIELNKLFSYAGSLNPSELKKISHGRTHLDFETAPIDPKITFIEKNKLIKDGQAELKIVRANAHKVLRSFNRETGISEFLKKAPKFQGALLIPADATLGLILRDLLTAKDYDLLTKSWRTRLGKLHPEDPEM